MAGARGIPRELAALFEPQTDQLGVRLERRGHIWVGEASGGKARGSMWLCAPTPHCLVLCHDVAPIEDMPLFEGSLGPYACACAMGGEAVACSRDCGLPVRLVRPRAKGMGRGDQVATFVERGPRLLTSRLFAGRAYRSRSIIALPGLFEELDRRYPGEFRGLFPAFGGDWDRGSKLAIERALDAIPPQPPLRPGGELGAPLDRHLADGIVGGGRGERRHRRRRRRCGNAGRAGNTSHVRRRRGGRRAALRQRPREGALYEQIATLRRLQAHDGAKRRRLRAETEAGAGVPSPRGREPHRCRGRSASRLPEPVGLLPCLCLRHGDSAAEMEGSSPRDAM